MLGPFASLFVVFAQAAGGGAAKAGDPNGYIQYAPFAVLPILFYFMYFRPEQAREKKRRSLIDNLKKNDKVLTAAGMYGTVLSVDEKGDRVQLRLDDDGKVKITFTKASIIRVFDPNEKPAEAK